MPTTKHKAAAEAWTASEEGSFAYLTVRDRLPHILAKIVDTTHRHKTDAQVEHGEDGIADIKAIVAQLSELRYQLQTNKPMRDFDERCADAKMWNAALAEHRNGEGDVLWFGAPFLLIECYMYRRVWQAFQLSAHLQSFDPFVYQKEQAFVAALPAMERLAGWLMGPGVYHDQLDEGKSLRQAINVLLQTSLWGNQYDLSLSGGEPHKSDDAHHETVDEQVAAKYGNILCDETHHILDRLMLKKDEEDGKRALHIVWDNAGMEVFADLCLAELLMHRHLVDKVVFHAKCHAWFVSDATVHDITWSLEMLRNNGNKQLNKLAHVWGTRLKENQFVIKTHAFWTSPHDFSRMKELAPELHDQLAEAHLILFKGDLNYRKLTNDAKWDCLTSMRDALRGFHPAPLAALRGLKADVCVGLNKKTIDQMRIMHGHGVEWMHSGEYGVIQYV